MENKLEMDNHESWRPERRPLQFTKREMMVVCSRVVAWTKEKRGELKICF